MCIALAAVLLASSTASARNKHRPWPNGARHYDARGVGLDGAHYFAPDDVRILRDYYGPRYRGLPPGLQKKLCRTGRLPPGWERKLRPFPVRLERRFVELPPYYRRGFLDGYAVVYDPRTRVIVDIAIVGR
jgi:hypothetical protein